MKTCTTCGDKVDTLHSHHIVPSVLGGLNIKGNLVKICAVCHGKIHDVNFLKGDRLRDIGIKRAKLNGTYKGRVKGAVETKETFLAKYPNVIEEVKLGTPIRTIRKKCGVSLGTIQKVKKYITANFLKGEEYDVEGSIYEFVRRKNNNNNKYEFYSSKTGVTLYLDTEDIVNFNVKIRGS